MSDPTQPEPEVATPEPDNAEAMRALDRARLPVATLADAIPHLRRPFTPEAIRFKVQSVFKQQDGTPFGCLIVAYIDQRLVTERLNRVIPDGWSATYEPIQGAKLMWCRLTVCGVTREDVGESPKGLSKDLVSDALKRAAVPFGVGVSCYALPQIRLTMDDARGRIEVRGKADKRSIVLTEYGHSTLREGYARWLDAHGVDRFGPPLDHGDVIGATIEEEPEAVAGIGYGDGDGTSPGWGDLDPDRIAFIEAIATMASERGHAGLADLPTLQMRVQGQPIKVVEEQIVAWQTELDEVGPKGEGDGAS